MENDDTNFELGFERAPSKEASPESIERGERFENELGDVPFAGETEQNDTYNAPAIIKYGANEAARIYGVEHTVNVIKNFNPNMSEDPVNDLLKDLGLERKEERNDALETNLTRENAFLDEHNNPNASKTISRQNAVQAIKDFQDMIRSVEADLNKYGDLREDAMNSGRGIFERAAEQRVEETGKDEDLVSMFEGIESQKRKTPEESENNSKEESTEESGYDESEAEQPGVEAEESSNIVSFEELQAMAKSADEAKEEEENKAA